MTERCYHWYSRYVVLKGIKINNYILVDTHLGFSSSEFEDLIRAISRGCPDAYYPAYKDLELHKEWNIVAESDVPFTKQAHPELFI